MCMLVIYEILKYQHWKKLFHLQSNRLKADESWNSIWYKKEKKTIVSKLIMNMLAKFKDNYDLNKTGESPIHLGIMSWRKDDSVFRHTWVCVKKQPTGPES